MTLKSSDENKEVEKVESCRARDYLEDRTLGQAMVRRLQLLVYFLHSISPS
jgi:hypothetical protein